MSFKMGSVVYRRKLMTAYLLPTPMFYIYCCKIVKKGNMKKLLWISWYAFDKRESVDPKKLTKYLVTVTVIGKRIDFRFMKQDGSWFFRCENLYSWWLRFKWNYLTNKNGSELPF